jgi:DNA replication protein DnaC
MPVRGDMSEKFWKGGQLMGDTMRRINPNDLLIPKNMSQDQTGTSSAAAENSTTMTTSDLASAAPTCPRCQGTGYYVLDVTVHDPNFGVLMPCLCKQLDKDQRASEERRKLSNLDAFANKTFKTFDQTVPRVAYAYEYAKAYAQRLSGWLILFGNYGCGKTHLAAAIANEALQRDYRVIFAIVPDLLDHLRSTFGPASDVSYDKRFEDIRSVPLLILDDLGTENTTPWAREKLFQIVNHRYNHRLPTVITSNRKPEDIEPRIYSRMLDHSLHDGIIMIEAGDYRRQRSDMRSTKRSRR